jgi:polysaccharide chain length determinant protein (PEP-CTERM system associated)
MYWSETTILVIPQRISEDIVRQTITTSVEDRLPSIRQALLSRTRLEALIEEFDLYPEERASMLMEDVVERMRSDVHMSVESGRTDAFRIAYSGRDPQKVVRVTERLANMTIEQSLSYRHNLARDTDEFLDTTLEEARRKLEEQERRVALYQQTHAGELPSQVNSNLQQVNSANASIQASLDAINRAMERRLLLEKQLADLEAPGAVVTSANSGQPSTVVPGSTLQQLTEAQDAFAALEARGLRAGHPDLEAARRRVRDLTQRLEAETQQSAAARANAPRPMSPAEAQRLARVAELRNEIDEMNRQITRAREEESQARASAQAAQARLDALPTRETDLISLQRDYNIMVNSYQSMLAKREEARIAASLEQRQVGEQFNIIDPARLPERPVSPDRTRLNLMGAAAGLAAGLALVALIEIRDRSFKTDDDVTSVLGLPVLAVVPLMESEQDHRQQLWKRIGIAAACLTVVVVCAVVFAYAVAG